MYSLGIFWILLINILCSFDYETHQPRASQRRIWKTEANSTCEPKSTEEFNHKSTWNSRVANVSGWTRQKRARVWNLLNFQNGRMIRPNKWANESLPLWGQAALSSLKSMCTRGSWDWMCSCGKNCGCRSNIHSSSPAFPFTASILHISNKSNMLMRHLYTLDKSSFDLKNDNSALFFTSILSYSMTKRWFHFTFDLCGMQGGCWK